MTPTPDEEKVDVAIVARTKAKAKSEKIEQWVSHTTIEDVIFDDSKPVQVGFKPEQTTTLVSIKGVSASQLLVTTLQKFCVKHSIGGYKNQPKDVMCNLVVRWAKGSKEPLSNLKRSKPEVQVSGTKRKGISTSGIGSSGGTDPTVPKALDQFGRVSTLFCWDCCWIVSSQTCNTITLTKSYIFIHVILIYTQVAEMLVLMKERNEQMAALDREKHIIDQDKALAGLLMDYTKYFKDSTLELADLRSSDGYDTDTSEAERAKSLVELFQVKRDAAFDAFKAHPLANPTLYRPSKKIFENDASLPDSD